MLDRVCCGALRRREELHTSMALGTHAGRTPLPHLRLLRLLLLHALLHDLCVLVLISNCQHIVQQLR